MTIQELEEWYAGRELPKEPVQIHKSTKIIDPAFFVEGRFYAIKANKDPRQQQPCIDKLMQFKKWLEDNDSTPEHS